MPGNTKHNTHLHALHGAEDGVEKQSVDDKPQLVKAVTTGLDVLVEGLNEIGLAKTKFTHQHKDEVAASRFLTLRFASMGMSTANVEFLAALRGQYTEASALNRLLAEEACKCAFYSTFKDEARKACATGFEHEEKATEMAKRVGLKGYGRAFGFLSKFAHSDTRMALTMWRGDRRSEIVSWPRYREKIFATLAKDMLRLTMIMNLHLRNNFLDIFPERSAWWLRCDNIDKEAQEILRG